MRSHLTPVPRFEVKLVTHAVTRESRLFSLWPLLQVSLGAGESWTFAALLSSGHLQPTALLFPIGSWRWAD